MSSTVLATFAGDAMPTNMVAETTRGKRGGVIGADSVVASQHGGDRLLGLDGQGEGVAVVRLLGVTEDELAKVGAPVVDLDAVALHDRTDDRHHRVECIGDALAAALPSSSAST